MLQVYLSRCCIYFTHVLQVFYLNVSSMIFKFFRCFYKCFRHMFQVFYLSSYICY
jgi:hypothetical protein